MIAMDFVSGWSQQVGDGSPIWGHADYAARRLGAEAVRRHTCGEDLTPRLLEIARLQREAAAHNATYVCVFEVYSYGMADFYKCLLAIPEADRPRIDWLLIVAGVNRAFDGQNWDDCWVLPACVARAICFVTLYRGIAIGGRLTARVIPECCPIRNGINTPGSYLPSMGAITRGWTDVGNSAVYANVECFWEGVDHGSVQDLPIVTATRTDLIDRLLQEEIG